MVSVTMKPSTSLIRLTLDCTAAAIVTGLAVTVVLAGIVLLVNGQATAAIPPGCGTGATQCGVPNHKDMRRP